MMKKPLTVSVIGPGALGGAMIDLVRRHTKFTLYSVWGRNRPDNYIVSSADDLSVPAHHTPESENDLGSLIIIAVPDDLISETADALSDLSLDWKDKMVIHLSGIKNDTELLSIREKGGRTASMHPLQTFTRGDTADRFDGIWVSLQGDSALFPVLKELVIPFGAKTKLLNNDQKAALHLSAVFSSNYLVALMKVVEEIAGDHDIENALELLNPLIHQTIENILEKGPAQSLSGPVLRGDISTIEQHLQILDGKRKPDHKTLYRNLGRVATRIAEQTLQNTGSDIDLDPVRDLFSNPKSGK